ncbi:MAG: zinc ABC transporter substrate-binding protein, partial [Desulfobulbaceae bacterium]|nr:zinc ABC transporter substrate-binding protein [Desulfobulbaceae bacterium]
MRLLLQWIGMSVVWMMLAGMGGFVHAEESCGRIRAFVSVLPQVYFVERVGGSRVVVDTLVQPGQDPHTYTPTPRQVAALAEAQLFFRVGMPFEENLMPKLAGIMERIHVVDLRQGILVQDSIGHDHHAHEEGHHEGEPDPHIWMNPMHVKHMAALIRDSLILLDPSGTDLYEKNFRAFADDLDGLHGRISKVLAPLAKRTIFVFHPAYGYFADAYGLVQKAVEAGGKEPLPRHLYGLIRKAKKDGVRVVFVQPQFSRKSAATIAKAINGVVLPLDPLAKDYMKNMEEMAEKVEEALRE